MSPPTTNAPPHRIPRDLESIHTAAQIARIHVRTLRSWIARGYITVYGRPKAYRVSLSDVLPIAINTTAQPLPRKTGWRNAPEAATKMVATRTTRRANRNTDAS